MDHPFLEADCVDDNAAERFNQCTSSVGTVQIRHAVLGRGVTYLMMPQDIHNNIACTHVCCRCGVMQPQGQLS
jgi:hypothetical protein